MADADLTRSQRFFAHWVGLVHRSARLVLLLAMIACVGAIAFTVRNIAINTSTTEMLSEEVPFRRHSEARHAHFPQYRNTLVIVVESESADRAELAADRLVARMAEMPERFRAVFYPQGERFFRQNGLLYLELDELDALADRLSQAQPLLSALHEDMSLRGLADLLSQALAEEEAEIDALAPVLERLAETSESVAAGQPEPLPWRDIISGEDGESGDMGVVPARVFIIAQPVLDYGSLAPAAAAIDQVEAFGEELKAAGETDFSLRITGEIPMQEDELKSVSDGIGLVGLLSFVLVISLLSIALRSWRLVLSTLVTLVAGLIWTTFFALAAIGELNLISVTFAVLFIGLSVDFGIHFALRYKEAVDGGLSTGPALERTAGRIGGALTLTACAAALGFFAFLPTSYRGLSELGLISGMGMFIALFANLTLLPALLSILPIKPSAERMRAFRLNKLLGFATRHSRPVLWGAALCGLASLAALPLVRFDDDPLNLRDPESPSVATLIDLLSDPQIQPYAPIAMVEDLASAQDTAARLKALPEVESVRVLSDFVPGDQDDKLLTIEDMAIFLTPLLVPAAAAAPPDGAERRVALERLLSALKQVEGPLQPEARRLATALGKLDGTDRQIEVLEQALLSGLPRQLDRLAEALEAGPVALDSLPAELRERYQSPSGPALIEILPSADLREQDARRAFVDAVLAVAPSASDGAVSITEAGRAVIAAFEQAATYAAIAIAILLVVVLRSVRLSLLVLAPLGLAALLTVSATVVFGMPFNFANVIVLPLLFGLGVAAGIHIVARERQEHSADLSATSTPRAVLFSALTTIGSFGALALSSHQGTASMGALLTLSIGISLVTMLVVLPALLARFAPQGE
ncbi:MAG: MMPL family transporter [Pseudomonadota bacterium]